MMNRTRSALTSRCSLRSGSRHSNDAATELGHIRLIPFLFGSARCVARGQGGQMAASPQQLSRHNKAKRGSAGSILAGWHPRHTLCMSSSESTGRVSHLAGAEGALNACCFPFGQVLFAIPAGLAKGQASKDKAQSVCNGPESLGQRSDVWSRPRSLRNPLTFRTTLVHAVRHLSLVVSTRAASVLVWPGHPSD
ncbi:hypothetical protein LX36DRAFT_77029 [Colletotrichum falcatum]|nr:hypothetical protein LX36DRAFT_77029 [Colletotrichum falcatum]